MKTADFPRFPVPKGGMNTYQNGSILDGDGLACLSAPQYPKGLPSRGGKNWHSHKAWVVVLADSTPPLQLTG